MTQSGPGQSTRPAAAALAVAVLAWLAAALAIWLIAASHAWASGCRIDKPLHNAGTLCLLLGGLLSVGAGIAGLIRLRKRRGRGRPFAMSLAATVMGAVGLVVCLVLFVTETSPHAVNPAYLHPC